MDLHIREQLSELAERLHLHRSAADVSDTGDVDALHEKVQGALDEGEHHGLGEALTEQAVHFDAEHPDLAEALRRVADALGAAGI